MSDRPLFAMGKLVATPEALVKIEEAGQKPIDFLMRHAAGDWGEVGAEDCQANDAALLGGERLLSAYSIDTSVKIWIITEADRSSTTILLPEEY
jgi:hypothetical protein